MDRWAHGLLSGRMTDDTTFAVDDWRSKSDLFAGEAFRRNLAVVNDLSAFAASRGATVAQLAIAWTLANPAVDVANRGGSQPDRSVGARSPPISVSPRTTWPRPR